MTQQHPITPPSDLLKLWRDQFYSSNKDFVEFLIEAAQWGADQELEVCCEVLNEHNPSAYWGELLRSRRRPKPPSLKEQALDLLDKAEDPSWDINDFSIVRRALEQLPDSIVVFPSKC